MPLKACIAHSEFTKPESAEIQECAHYLEAIPPAWQVKGSKFDELGKCLSRPKSSIQEPPKLELKSLPRHIKYAYMGDVSSLSVIKIIVDSSPPLPPRRRPLALNRINLCSSSCFFFSQYCLCLHLN